MTHEQYERWKDFATRMARTCFKKYRRPPEAWIIKQVDSWFWWRDYQQDWGEYNSWDQDDHPLCDHITEFYDGVFPMSGRCKACEHQWQYCLARLDNRECKLCEMDCTCHEKSDACYWQFEEQWLGPVNCCLRAGIDFACEPSAGVIGFTAGDVRRMYPEGVPEWVFPPDERLHYWLSDKINGTFAELPDSAGVVL